MQQFRAEDTGSRTLPPLLLQTARPGDSTQSSGVVSRLHGWWHQFLSSRRQLAFAGIVVGALLLMAVVAAAKGRGQASTPAGACAVHTVLHIGAMLETVLHLHEQAAATSWMHASGWASICFPVLSPLNKSCSLTCRLQPQHHGVAFSSWCQRQCAAYQH